MSLLLEAFSEGKVKRGQDEAGDRCCLKETVRSQEEPNLSLRIRPNKRNVLGLIRSFLNVALHRIRCVTQGSGLPYSLILCVSGIPASERERLPFGVTQTYGLALDEFLEASVSPDTKWA